MSAIACIVCWSLVGLGVIALLLCDLRDERTRRRVLAQRSDMTTAHRTAWQWDAQLDEIRWLPETNGGRAADTTDRPTQRRDRSRERH